jgi:hypothetical protein
VLFKERDFFGVGDPYLRSTSLTILLGSDLKPTAALHQTEMALRAFEGQANRNQTLRQRHCSTPHEGHAPNVLHLKAFHAEASV